MFYSFLSQHLQNMGRNYSIKKGKAQSLWLPAKTELSQIHSLQLKNSFET